MQDVVTGKQQSLRTGSQTEAERLWHARDEATANPQINVVLARVYLSVRHQAFEAIQRKPMVETTTEDFLIVLKAVGVMRGARACVPSTIWPPAWVDCRGRSCHPSSGRPSNFSPNAASHGRSICKSWPRKNPERRLYYDLLRETGTSQSDAAILQAENIDWSNRSAPRRSRRNPSGPNHRTSSRLLRTAIAENARATPPKATPRNILYSCFM